MRQFYGIRRWMMVLVCGITPALAGSAWAQSGKELYESKGCTACHGPDGKSTTLPVYPKLAGQNAEYVVQQLLAYRKQERTGTMAPMMWAMAAQLNADDMRKIADYLASLNTPARSAGTRRR